MDKLAASLTLPATSNSEVSTSDRDPRDYLTGAECLQAAERMYGLYRKSDACDPEVFAAGAAAVFSEYPREVVAFVTDPRTGLPRTSKWPPTVSEVGDACQAIMDQRAAAEARERRRQAWVDERRREEEFERTHGPRPSYQQLVARCAEKGLMIGPNAGPARPLTGREIEDFKTAHGVSDDVWASIPDAPKPKKRARA